MGEENNFQLAPWVKEYKEKEKARQTWLQQQEEKYAQSVEDSKHPNGHYMNEIIVTPQGTSLGTVSSDAMLDNLVSTQRESAVRERKQSREMIQHIHEGTDGAAKWLAPLVTTPAFITAGGPIMQMLARPLTTTARVASTVFPKVSRILPHTQMADRGIMGYLGTTGMYNTGKKWYKDEIPWYSAVPQMALEGLMVTDVAPGVSRGLADRTSGVIDLIKYGIKDRIQGFKLYNKYLRSNTYSESLENLFKNGDSRNIISDQSGILFMQPATYTRSEVISSGPYSIRMGFTPTKKGQKLSRELVSQGKSTIDNLPVGTSISADAHGISIPSRLSKPLGRRNPVKTLLEGTEDAETTLTRIEKLYGDPDVTFVRNPYDMSADAHRFFTLEAQKPGRELVYAGRSGKFNDYAVSNPQIYQWQQAYEAGNMSAREYIQNYNNWVKQFNGRPGHIDLYGKPYFYHPTIFITHKQGGKMNILQFLKNGSGIHIKKENRGKFTDYCGGKVTSECIAKGKRSSNPAIRKRATFAANARKWKHEDGGIIRKMQTAAGGPLVYEDEIVPNDNVWIDVLGKKKNPQLEDAAVRGAQIHRMMEEAHPIATQWGYLAGATPFLLPTGAAASTVLPEVVVGARALGTAAKASKLARGTAPFFKRIAASKPFRNLARIPYKAIGKFGNKVLSGLFFGHGVKKSVQEGGVSPVTALELASGTALVKDANNIYKDAKELRKLSRNIRATSVTTPEVTSGVAASLAPPPAEITVNLGETAANTTGRQAIRQAAATAATNPTPAGTISPEAQGLQQLLTHYDTGDFSDIQYYDDLAKAVIDGRLPKLTHELTTTPYINLPYYEQQLYDKLGRVFTSDTWKLNTLQKELKTAMAEGRSEQEINLIKDQIRDIKQRSQNLGEVPIIDRQGSNIEYGGNSMHYFLEGPANNINIEGASFFNPYGRPDVFLSKVWDQLKSGDKISIANGFGHLSINSLPLYLSSLTRRLNQAMINPAKEKGFLLEALSDRYTTNSLGKIPYRGYLIEPDYSNPLFSTETAAKLQKLQQELYDTYDQFNYFRKIGALGKSYRTDLWKNALDFEKLPVEKQRAAWQAFFRQHPEIEAEVQNNILNNGLIERLPQVNISPISTTFNSNNTVFEYPGFEVTHLLFGGKLFKKEFTKKINKIFKKGGKAFVNGVSVLDSNLDAYKFVKRKMRKAAGGDNTGNWYQRNSETINALGSTLAENLPSIVKAIQSQKKAQEQVIANEIANKVKKSDLIKKNYQANVDKMETTPMIVNGELINKNPDIEKHFAYQKAQSDANSEMQAIENETQLENAKLLAEGNAGITNAITGTIGEFAKTGLGLLANYKGKNNQSTSGQASVKSSAPPVWMQPYYKNFSLS